MRPLFDSEHKPIAAPPRLRTLCEARQRDLAAELAELDVHSAGDRAAMIVTALEAVGGLLTVDLDRIPPAASAQLRAWLRHSVYLGAKGTDAR